MKPYMGQPVTTNTPVEATASNFAGRPFCEFVPGDTGNVVAINLDHVLVSFHKHGRNWYVRLTESQLERIWP